ncbi:hypothetical protein ACSI5N_25715 (plasmid) [Raoultella ornithinolytica]|uniref:hypothetical protein n=1 Tax=Raoultella ornithinolytica TaxID=54291 RepID=UPI00292B32FA|nr:hypothetical protein [Raoultella ornithinolytica]MDV1095025.1 hypothetical protein [Raoultella ornithinolytica]MDV1124021.1 hypothetical protein [Raoultella ornithinolytica]MDV1894285.1 hypothetical protein [Raoultella ornithinolytica]
MAGEQNVTAEAFTDMNWKANHCQITGCRATVVAGGTRSRLQGMVTLTAGAAKIRLRWRTLQVVADDRASAPLHVEQEYKTLPTISGVLLVDSTGVQLTHEEQMKLAMRVIGGARGAWEAKVKYVAQLMS